MPPPAHHPFFWNKKAEEQKASKLGEPSSGRRRASHGPLSHIVLQVAPPPPPHWPTAPSSQLRRRAGPSSNPGPSHRACLHLARSCLDIELHACREVRFSFHQQALFWPLRHGATLAIGESPSVTLIMTLFPNPQYPSRLQNCTSSSPEIPETQIREQNT
ncbi:hydroxymethylglutaryl-CoA reductase, degradative [Sesbania bispinosa]|nr:hydroxymethylglutaryl-CoA reductase, degradative [Sesbania bispinosa]